MRAVDATTELFKRGFMIMKASVEAEIKSLDERINKLIMKQNEKTTEFWESGERFNNALRVLIEDKAHFLERLKDFD